MVRADWTAHSPSGYLSERPSNRVDFVGLVGAVLPYIRAASYLFEK